MDTMKPLPPDLVGVRFEDRFGCRGIRFEEVSYDAGFGDVPHVHGEAFFVLPLQGKVHFASKSTGSFLQTPASLTHIPVDERHSGHFREACRTFQIVIPTSWLDRVREVIPLAEAPAHYDGGRPVWTASRIYREFRHRDALTPLALEGMLLELVAETSRWDADRTDAPPWLRRAMEYLHDHFAETVSPDALAAEVGVHPSHLMRAFRRHHGCSIGDYLRRLRVECACHLLGGDTPLGFIAHQVGFADQSHLHRHFKAIIGMTPAEFRRAAQGATHGQRIALTSKTLESRSPQPLEDGT